MKKKKHLHTKYLKFLIERNLDDADVDDGVERPLPDDEDVTDQETLIEMDDEETEEDTIEQLQKERKNLEKLYEYLRVRNRRK